MSDAFAQPREFMTFSDEEHPFNRFDWFLQDSELLEYFVPRTLFSSSAQKFTEFNMGCSEVVENCHDILAIFTYLYTNSYNRIYLPRLQSDVKQAKARASHAVSPDSELRDAEVQHDNEADEERELKNAFRNRNTEATIYNTNPDALFALFEKVPHRNSTRANHVDAGMRLRIVSNNASCSLNFSSMLASLLVKNEKRIDREISGGRRQANLMRYHLITFERYCTLVSLYIGRPLLKVEMNREGFYLPDSVINPRNVFSIRNSCGLARLAGAKFRYTDEDNYVDGAKQYLYPSNRWLYLLKDSVMKPDRFHNYLWPHVMRPSDDSEQEKLFVRMFVPPPSVSQSEEEGLDPVTEDPEAQRQKKAAEKERLGNEGSIRKLFRMFHGTKLTRDNAMDLASLKRHQRQRNDNVLSQACGDPEKLRVLRTISQIEGIAEFKQIYHKNGDLPNSLKSICAWMDNHLALYRNFCLPFKKQSTNMSRFADVMSVRITTLAIRFKVATLQADVVHGLIKSYHVYSGCKFHTHGLYLGPSKVGKTFVFRVLQLLLIAKTWQEYTYQTAKSNTSAGKQFDQLIEFFEEVPPSLIGVQHTKPGQKQSSTAGTDQEAAFKLKLTNGLVVVKLLVIDPLTGKRATVEYEVPCNTVLHLASNEPLSSISESMLSRFAVKQFQMKDRPAADSVLEKMQTSDTKESTILVNERVYREQRNQAMVAVIFALLDAGILHKIDMTAAYIVIAEVLKRARACGLSGTDDVRNFERAIFDIAVHVVLDAADLLFDSEMSPLSGKPFDFKDLLLVEMYLKATVEHTVFSLGMLHEQFESDVSKNVVRSLMGLVFKDAVTEEASGVPPFPGVEAAKTEDRAAYLVRKGSLAGYQTPDHLLRQEDDNARYAARVANTEYYEAVFPWRSKAPGMTEHLHIQQWSRLSKEDMVRKLSMNLWGRMKGKKPQEDDMYDAINQLTLLPVHETSAIFRLCPSSSSSSSSSASSSLTSSSSLSSGSSSTSSSSSGSSTTGTALNYALYFADGKLYLSKKTVANFENASLKNIIRDVLSNLTRTKRQYLYGITEPGRPTIWQTIVVTPKTARGPMYVTDPNFVDARMRQFEESAGEHMHAERFEPREEHKPENRAKFFDGVHSKSKSMILDEDLDRYVTLKRITELGLTKDDLDGMPSPFPDIFLNEVIRHAQDEEGRDLLAYPHNFPFYSSHSNSKKAAEKHGRDQDETERLSMKAKMARMTNSIGISLPPIIEQQVCESNETDESYEADPHSDDDVDGLDSEACFNGAVDDDELDALAADLPEETLQRIRDLEISQFVEGD